MPEIGADPAKRARYFETVERETRRLATIVKDLLDLAGEENAAEALDIRVFATERVFQHVVQRHEHETHQRGLTVGTRVDLTADQMVADPNRIEQVIENLFANALRHTPANGTIELTAIAAGDSVVLCVIDSGSGIATEPIPHVFDRFYKVDPSRAARSEGSGLGLSIVKAIVERHGGSLTVTSRPGRTEFRVTLPQTEPATPPDTRHESDPAAEPTTATVP